MHYKTFLLPKVFPLNVHFVFLITTQNSELQNIYWTKMVHLIAPSKLFIILLLLLLNLVSYVISWLG